MNNSKLITVLKSLKKREFSRFIEFAESPFFNKNKKLTILLKEIRKYYPFDDLENLQKEKIYVSIFTGEVYNESKLKNLVSDLYELAEKFLVYILREENQLDFNRDLLKATRERNAEKSFYSSVNAAEKKLRSLCINDRDYFNYKWLLERENNFFYSERDRTKYSKNLQNEFDNYLKYSLIMLLEYYIRIVNEQGYANIKLNHTLQNEVIEFIGKNEFLGEPVIEIFYSALMLRITQEEKYFLRLKELKSAQSGSLNKQDLNMINSNLHSFYLAQEQLGINIYRYDFFELQKESLEEYSTVNKIPFILFFNLIKTAANLKEFEWAKDFTDSYGLMLADRYKNASINYANAYILYMQGMPDKALEILAKTHSETATINLEIKKLMAIIYYETGSIDASYSIVDSFRHFVNSGQLPSAVLKKMLLEFLKYYNELLKIRNDRDSVKAEMLLKKIEQNPKVSNKFWLIRKTKELFS